MTCVFSQGLYLSGVIGDRVNLRYVLCFGLCGSATVVGGAFVEWRMFITSRSYEKSTLTINKKLMSFFLIFLTASLSLFEILHQSRVYRNF